MTPPSLIPTESGNRVNTDKKGSLKLARLLETVPGIRMEILVEFVDVSRFHKADKLAAYLGLTTFAVFQRKTGPDGPHHPYWLRPAQSDSGGVIMVVDRQGSGHALKIRKNQVQTRW